jgi:hypothetical protein
MRYASHAIQAGKLALRAYLPDYHISIRDIPEHPEYPEHTHEFTELVVAIVGIGISCVEGIESQIAAGDVYGCQQRSDMVLLLRNARIPWCDPYRGFQSLPLRHWEVRLKN